MLLIRFTGASTRQERELVGFREESDSSSADCQELRPSAEGTRAGAGVNDRVRVMLHARWLDRSHHQSCSHQPQGRLGDQDFCERRDPQHGILHTKCECSPVAGNIAVARGKLCVQTCEVDTHQLPADIDMHILKCTHKRESARRAAIEVKTKHTKA